MAITVKWEGGDGVTLIPSGSYVGFYGTTFNQSIPLNNYNQLTIATDRLGTTNNGELPNAQFTTPGYGIFKNVTHGTISGSIGTLFSNTGADMTLHIRITSGSAVFLTNVNLIAFSGISLAQAPQNVQVIVFESGRTSWTPMVGVSQPLALTPHTATATAIHDYYVSISISPTTKAETHQTLFALQADYYR